MKILWKLNSDSYLILNVAISPNKLGINFVKVEETDTVVGDIRCAITDLPDAGWGGVAVISGDYLGNLDNYFFLNGSTDSDIYASLNSIS